MKIFFYSIVIYQIIVFNTYSSFANSNVVSDSVRILSFNILYGGDEID